MADEPEKKLADEPEKKLRKRGLQTPGNLSKVSVPVIAKIFRERYRKGASSIIFSLDDVRNACDALGVASRNPADVIYRMRSRTILPAEIPSSDSMCSGRLVAASTLSKKPHPQFSSRRSRSLSPRLISRRCRSAGCSRRRWLKWTSKQF
jgi:hypothetical protein